MKHDLVRQLVRRQNRRRCHCLFLRGVPCGQCPKLLGVVRLCRLDSLRCQALDKCLSGVAVVLLHRRRNRNAVLHHRFCGTALDVNDTVHRTGTGTALDNGRFPRGQNAQRPGGRAVDAACLVAPSSTHALCQLVHVEPALAVAVLGKLQFVDAQGNVVEKAGSAFVAHLRGVERLHIPPQHGIAPDARRKHQPHGLARAGFRAPEVYEKRQRSDMPQQHTGKGCRQQDLCRAALLPAADSGFPPHVIAALGTDRPIHLAVVALAVKGQVGLVRGKYVVVPHVPQPSHTVSLRQNVIVPVFDIAQVFHQCLGVFRGHRHTDRGQLRHLVRHKQHVLAVDCIPPPSALAEGNFQLFLAGINVDEPFHRHDRVRAGNDGHALHVLLHPVLTARPLAAVQFQRLVRERRGVLHIGVAAHVHIPLCLGVFLVHALEFGKAHGVGIIRQLFQPLGFLECALCLERFPIGFFRVEEILPCVPQPQRQVVLGDVCRKPLQGQLIAAVEDVLFPLVDGGLPQCSDRPVDLLGIVSAQQHNIRQHIRHRFGSAAGKVLVLLLLLLNVGQHLAVHGITSFDLVHPASSFLMELVICLLSQRRCPKDGGVIRPP